jgi:hypothetical protein
LKESCMFRQFLLMCVLAGGSASALSDPTVLRGTASIHRNGLETQIRASNDAASKNLDNSGHLALKGYSEHAV